MAEKKLTRWTQFAPDKPAKGTKKTPADKFCAKHNIELTRYVGCRWELRFGTRRKRLIEWSTRTGDVTLDGRFEGKEVGWDNLKKRLERILLADMLGGRPPTERKASPGQDPA